jgi:cation transport ATPase
MLENFFGVGIPDQEALRLALSLERCSEHSLGRAVAGAAHGLDPYEVEAFSAVPGKGVRGTVLGRPALIGSREFIEAAGIQNSIDAALNRDQQERLKESEKNGSTVIFLCHDGNLRGVFVVSDKVRNEAAEAVLLLKKAGHGVAMVTGDDLSTAEAVAKRTGIGPVKARVSPMDKAGEVRRLEDEGKHVLMAGDGINDAPALVAATIGVALGRATDIALESADIVIMRSDLRLIADAVALSKKTFRVIRQNIFWAFFYNAAVIPLAILGILHPIVAAGAMAISSLTVVGNSWRARLQ